MTRTQGIAIICLLIVLSTLPSGVGHRSQAYADFHQDSLWARWGGITLRLQKSDTIAQWFAAQHAAGRFNGAVIVEEKGTILHQGAYGYADFRQQDSLSLQTAFQLASVSKVFTATAVLLLQQEGLLCVDDPVEKFFPAWPYEGMTLRHLLNHRSGLPRYMAVASWYWQDPKVPMSNADVVAQYCAHAPTHFFQPGTGFNYNNTNYVLLAEVVAQVSGLPFGEFLQQRIFGPAGMENSGLYPLGATEPPARQVATGYRRGWRGPFPAYRDYIDGVVGDKGLYASAEDLIRFEQALRNNELLSPELLAEAWTPGSAYQLNNYGFGWRLRQEGENQLIYHFGWWRGFRTCYLRDPASERTLILLSNTDGRRYNLNYWQVLDFLRSLEREV